MPYWTDTEKAALTAATSFDEAADVALVILSRMHAEGKPIVQICGPMTTGGLGDLAANMRRFQAAVDAALAHGLLVFNQMPFQSAIARLKGSHRSPNGYNMDILEVFYRKIFESGYPKKVLFLPDWESSVGARWERNIARQLSMEVGEYPVEWLPVRS